MATYNISFTDSSKPDITVNSDNVNTDYDIHLFGRNRLKYGQNMNNNFLHLLERFACPESPGNQHEPDLFSATEKDGAGGAVFLQNPVDGQLWYNSTQSVLNVWSANTSEWLAITNQGDIVINWGTISHGQTIPIPTSNSGYVFDRSECSWIVSPKRFNAAFTEFTCTTDSTGLVTMTYKEKNTGIQLEGEAEYFIVAVRDNVNAGLSVDTTPNCIQPSPTPSTTVTHTQTPVPTESVAPSQTPIALNIRTEDYTKNVGTLMNSILMFSNIPDDTGNLGINCSTGSGVFCANNETAPTSNGLANMRIIVSGGTPPYDVTLRYTGPTGSFPSTECFNIGFDSNVIVSNGTPSGTILSNFTIVNSEGFKDGVVAVGKCGFTEVNFAGEFSIEAVDSTTPTPQSVTVGRGWRVVRTEDAPPVPSDTPTNTPTPTPSKTLGVTPTKTPTPTPTPSTTQSAAPLQMNEQSRPDVIGVFCYQPTNCDPDSPTLKCTPVGYASTEVNDYYITGGDGNYTITLDTSNVDNSVIPFINPVVYNGKNQLRFEGNCESQTSTLYPGYVIVTATDGSGASTSYNRPVWYESSP